MTADWACPHCGYDNGSEILGSDQMWDSEDTLIVTSTCRCDECGKEYVVSEVLAVSSRLVAKDHDELVRLIEEEGAGERLR